MNCHLSIKNSLANSKVNSSERSIVFSNCVLILDNLAIKGFVLSNFNNFIVPLIKSCSPLRTFLKYLTLAIPSTVRCLLYSFRL